jgi:hypothetical protein
VLLRREALAMSVTISVKAQKYGGLCDHAIGRESGMATSGVGWQDQRKA